ncbi:site-specific DNA-methyltransferase [Weissella paramesenteroides]|uniref:DNA methyltransferase n=1 Tax=Weissella paramesenteroides TaxID=1249 RepID=UPI003F200565
MSTTKSILKGFGKTYFTEAGLLRRNRVIEDLEAYTPMLMKSLLANKLIHNTYTESIVIDDKSVEIFKLNQFIEMFTYKEYWQDSYTKFENKIGLTAGGKFIDETADVVLDFPFKDTVLKAGMKKEDQKDADEPFLHETIAKAEIDQLLEPKIFVNATKYDQENLDGAPVDAFDDENLIIKGNNLIALRSLKSKFAGKIKSIFIDPPYNTGQGSFNYNDNFNHAAWLTFIKNRLDIAKELLTSDGSISMTIDYNELSYLLALGDSVFGRNNLQNIITVKRASASGAKVINPGVVNVSDYLVIYSNNKDEWKPNKVFAAKERDKRYNQFIQNVEAPYSEWEFTTLLDAFAKSKNMKKTELKKVLGDSYNRLLDQFAFEHADSIFQWVSLDDSQISQEARNMKYNSKNDPDNIYYMERTGYNDYYMKNGKTMLFMRERLIEVDGELAFGTAITDIWTDVLPNDLHNEGGVSFKKGKKPEKLIKRIIELTSNAGDLVLDFFAGSGTTGAVAHKIDRKWILIDQMEYINDVLKTRLIRTMAGINTAGISKDVNWRGGGSFIYAELMEKNQGYLKDVQHSETTKQLEGVVHRMVEGGADFDFRVDVEKVLQDPEYQAMSVDDKKQLMVKVIDKNQLYYAYSDMEDRDVQDLMSESDIAFNKSFYEERDM